MKQKIVLLPGEPNDANRDYLPQAIKGSKMVVNENGNNSQVYPKRLRECRGRVTDDEIEDVWYEYVPESYDPTQKTPLVFSMHGGLMTGWGQCIYTSWSQVADREGVICVFPTAHDHGMWMIECDPQKAEELSQTSLPGVPVLNRPTGTVEDYHDVKLVVALLQKMKQAYNIDEGRVYLQGMSMGNAMTSQLARYFGNLFAGAAGSGCPTNCKLLFTPKGALINKGGPLDIWQSRLEWDKTPPHYDADDREVVLGNHDYWRRVNDATGLPQIKIIGEKNLAFYRGVHGNVVLMDVHNRDHGQTFDDAQMVWDYLFSGVRRGADGKLVHTVPLKKNEGDQFALALVRGGKNAWFHNKLVPVGQTVFRWDKLKYHGLKGDAIVRGSYLYVPLRFLAQVFDCRLREIQNGLAAELQLPDGRTMQFARGCIGCVVDNGVEAMLCEAVYAEGALCISAEWFCRYAYNLQVSSYGDVLYLTDHYAVLSRYMAWILEDLLTGKEAEKQWVTLPAPQF